MKTTDTLTRNRGGVARRTPVAWALMAAAALCAPALGGAAELFSNFNTCTVSNLTPGHFGYPPTIVSLQFPSHVTGLATYHWNNGRGAAPGPQGTITLAPLIVPTGTG